jgi:glycopeptide antibiotics resistance protein
MITNFLLEHTALVPVTLLLIAVVCVGFGYLALRSHRYAFRILWMLATLSMVPVLALTLVPTPSPADVVTCTVQFSMPTLGSAELLANLALFFPPVFFAGLATRRPLPTLAGATVLSAAIEAVQALVPAIDRACDTNDWAMNTAGAILAVLVASATTVVFNRRAARNADTGSDRAERRPPP